jgi:hypothetical protein
MAAVSHILNDGDSYSTLSSPPETYPYSDVETAELELSKGNSPFHKVRPISGFPSQLSRRLTAYQVVGSRRRILLTSSPGLRTGYYARSL